MHLFISTIGFNHTLSDMHGFRQTQTAISVDYLIKEAFTLNYITPSLGAPWIIPNEFPTYQFTVAIFSKLTQINLIYSGRIISLLFFYLTLIFVNKAFKLINLESNNRKLILALILCSPVYLFWSRTFMIESTALFLTFAFIFFIIKFTQTVTWKTLMLALAFGGLAALTKSTIFATGSLLILIYLAFMKKLFNGKIFTKSVYVLAILGSIFVINTIWVRYTDYLKSQNPLAAKFIVTEYLKEWYFGTPAQRLDKNIWDTLAQRINHEASIHLPILVTILLLGIILTKYRLFIVAFLLVFISGPLIFLNVYWIHNYYLYENAIYLQIALGLALGGLWQTNKLRNFVNYALVPLVFTLLLLNYYQNYYPSQSQDNRQMYNIAQVIKSYTNKQDVLLIYGYDWNPEIPFYAERKAIMDRWNYPLYDIRILQSIKNTGKENIRAMFTNNLDPNFVNERINYFNFQKEPIFQNQYGALYIRN